MSDLENEDPEDNLAQLRQAADDGRKAREEADRARRELAFAKAGIDTESGVGKLAFNSYDGEPTKDAVLAFAAEYGINPGSSEPESEPKVAITDDEKAQSRERSALSTQSEPPGQEPDIDPRAAALARYKTAVQAGDTVQEASADYFGTILGAAANGDQRVIYNASDWKARNSGSSKASS